MTKIGSGDIENGLANYYASPEGGQCLFIATHPFGGFGSVETPLLYLSNPPFERLVLHPPPRKTVCIHRLCFGGDGNIILRSYRNPTVIGGATPAIVNRGGGDLTSLALLAGHDSDNQIEVSDLGTPMHQHYAQAYGDATSLEEGSLVLNPGDSFLWTAWVATAQDSEVHIVSMTVIWWELPIG
jgi:hypothetical protein